jgi:hypothetical protein
MDVTDRNVAQPAKQLLNTRLPENVFDAELKIPSTAVSVRYPNRGFYGFGSSIVTINGIDPSSDFKKSIRIQPTGPYGEGNSSEYVTVNAGGIKKLGRNERLDTLVDSIMQDWPNYVSKENQMYVEIEGHRFFIYRELESETIWQAVTTYDGAAVGISLAYSDRDGSYVSRLADEHNNELFLQILSHLKFE